MRPSVITAWQRGALWGVAALCAAGCGPRTGELHGTVTFDGKPVDRGRIVLVRTQEDTRIHQAAVMSGSYALVAPAGTYRVEIFALHDDEALAADQSLPMQYIPAAYNSESTLTAEIAAGTKQERAFNLTNANQ